jgi:hypothetical protein
MKKAIKFFRKDGDLLRPVYYDSAIDHPNYKSKLGEEQTFQPDPKDPNRQAFSTISLRDPSSRKLLEQLLNTMVYRNSTPFIVGVDDEYKDEESVKHLDAPSERLFRKIKPLLELILPKEVIQDWSNERHNIIKALNKAPDRKEAINENIEYAKRYVADHIQYILDNPVDEEKEKAEAARLKALGFGRSIRTSADDADIIEHWNKELKQRLDKYNAELKDISGQVKSAYKIMRENGYSPMDIQNAIDAWKQKDMNFYRDRSGLADMLRVHKHYDEALDALVAELEADPDMESDRRLKRLIPATQGVV